jgi:hypothetical protein
MLALHDIADGQVLRYLLEFHQVKPELGMLAQAFASVDAPLVSAFENRHAEGRSG